MTFSFGSITFSKQLFVLLAMGMFGAAFAQQRPDTSFTIEIDQPRFSGNTGPLILIDGMHNNLHLADGNFAPFAKLARTDGFKVQALLDWKQLEKASILVIANPINQANLGNWRRPIFPAFTEDEIAKIKAFVEQGGRLLLIADHMPFAGAANDLATAFGFDFCDGFAQLSDKENGRDVFTKQNHRLPTSIIVDGTFGEPIEKVYSFMGSSFSAPDSATIILKFEPTDVCLAPEVAWQFNENTPSTTLENKVQGAIMPFGQGKVAVFGEAAMFTAQAVNQNGNTFYIGFNSPFATENVDFIRHILAWLAA